MTTPTSRLLKITNDFKQRLLAQEAQAVAALERAHAATLEEIKPVLDRLYVQIGKELETLKKGEKIPPAWIYERIRLENLKLLITHHVDQFGVLSLQQTRMLQHLGVQLGLQSSMEQLDATVPKGVQWTFGQPSVKAIENLVGATQKGSPLADLFNGFGQEAATEASNALVTGVTLGWNPRRIAPIVADKLDISRARSLTISRTESLRAYRGAAWETYRANDDVVSMWVWVASMSTRTCIACILMNGTKHSLDEELNDHPCGRCSPAPLTKDWSSILGPLGIDTSDLEDTRLSIQSGEEWFMAQDESVQRQIFGNNAAYDLWANNDHISLQDFVHIDHDPDWGSSIQVRSASKVKALVKA
jgi:hypothetical protein